MRKGLFTAVFALMLLATQDAQAADYVKGGYCVGLNFARDVAAKFQCDAFGKDEVTIPEIYKRGWRVVSAVQISGSQAHTLSLVIEEQPKPKK